MKSMTKIIQRILNKKVILNQLILQRKENLIHRPTVRMHGLVLYLNPPHVSLLLIAYIIANSICSKKTNRTYF